MAASHLQAVCQRKSSIYSTIASLVIRKDTETSCIRRGYCTYSCFDDFKKFQEEKLPPREFWKDSPQNGAMMLIQEKWKHAVKVYEKFNCSNMGDYHDLYLKTNTFILACVVEEFWTLCYRSMAWIALITSAARVCLVTLSWTKCRADIELLTDCLHLEMVVDMIKGGVASVFDKNFSKQTTGMWHSIFTTTKTPTAYS